VRGERPVRVHLARPRRICCEALPGTRVETVTVGGGEIAVRAVNGSAEPLAQIPK